MRDGAGDYIVLGGIRSPPASVIDLLPGIDPLLTGGLSIGDESKKRPLRRFKELIER